MQKKVPYVEQFQSTECGLCCVAMILRYYGSNETLQELRNYLEVGRDGTSLVQINGLMKKMEFETKIYKAKTMGLFTLKLPAILFWENNHFVVLEKINSKHAYIVDPALGRRKLTLSELDTLFATYVIVPHPSPKFIPKKKNHDILKYFFKLILKKKILILNIIFLSVITYMCNLGVPIVMQKLVDTAIKHPKDNAMWIRFVAIFIGLFIYSVFNFINGKQLIKLKIHIDKSIATNVFSHLMKVPYKFFDVRSKANILFAINSCSIIRELFVQNITRGFINIGATIFIIFYMCNQSIKLTIIALGLFAVNIISILITRPFLFEANQYLISEQSKLQGIQMESIYSILGIKMSSIENNVYDSWSNMYQSYLNKYRYSEVLRNGVGTISEFIKVTSPMIIMCMSIYFLTIGEFTPGQVMAFYSLSQTFFASSSSIFDIWNSFIIANTYLERLIDIIRTEEEKESNNSDNKFSVGDIALHNVSFSYTKNSQNVVQDINLSIKKGEKIAIVGKSGSGKSTLAKILVGLYSPTKGDIFYSGINLNDIDKKQLRRQMGIVPQDVTLFNKSILENIVMGRKNITLNQVKEACDIAQISEEIESMPMGYYTMISEMGGNLSGGQRQRIVLARAILNNPKVIILDEATSSLDTINEEKISDYFKNIGCTRIVIAHRLSTIVDSDKIIVTDKGRIVEVGTHNQLMNKMGKYFELYNCNNEIEFSVLRKLED